MGEQSEDKTTVDVETNEEAVAPLYSLVVWDEDEQREIPFAEAWLPLNLIMLSGSVWLDRFPNDIVMAVEQT